MDPPDWSNEKISSISMIKINDPFKMPQLSKKVTDKSMLEFFSS